MFLIEEDIEPWHSTWQCSNHWSIIDKVKLWANSSDEKSIFNTDIDFLLLFFKHEIINQYSAWNGSSHKAIVIAHKSSHLTRFHMQLCRSFFMMRLHNTDFNPVESCGLALPPPAPTRFSLPACTVTFSKRRNVYARKINHAGTLFFWCLKWW